jgi:hypothetical protein
VTSHAAILAGDAYAGQNQQDYQAFSDAIADGHVAAQEG